MTLNQMQYFQCVCKHESYTKAAQELHVTQPAISLAIRDIEKACGVALFLRDKNSLQITDEGYVLLEEILILLKQYDHINYVIKDLALNRKYVRVGLSTLSGNHVYPFIRSEFYKHYPDIDIISIEESTKKQFKLLDEDQLDVIITIRRYQNEEDQHTFEKVHGHWPLRNTELVFCLSKEHPFATKTYIREEEMSQVPLVLLDDTYNQTLRIKEMFALGGLEPNVIHCTKQMYTIERFVEQGMAGGFLPRIVADQNPDIVGIPYVECGDTQIVEMFWRKDRFQFTATKLFIDLVKRLYPKAKYSTD